MSSRRSVAAVAPDSEPARAAATARARLGDPIPETAVVLGSGLSDLELEEPRRIPYSELPGWPAVGVKGHAGQLVVGTLGGTPVLCLRGRAHLYEGHRPADVVFPVRVLNCLGVRTLILTNAAGSLDALLPPGRLMLVADHLNLMWGCPPAGPVETSETRWTGLQDCYDPELRRLIAAIARNESVAMVEGVYAGVLGPAYETPAEVRMLRALGADAVGMSTVPEAITARALGMRVAAISCITNLASGIGIGSLSHADVIEATAALVPALARLLARTLPRLA